MIFVQPGLFVTVVQLDDPRAPLPLPLASGFTTRTAYHVLGAFTPSETSEAYFILSNEAGEIWFISNRHLRAHRLLPQNSELRFLL